jgi:hypothetical protein
LPARYWFWSRYAHWWWNINWLVRYRLYGNEGNMNFNEWSSLMSKPPSDDNDWSQRTGYPSV